MLAHLRALGRGRVTILAVDGEVVSFRYQGTGHEASSPVTGFVALYDWLAADESTADREFGPQVRPSARLLADMPVRMGTAVER